MTDEGNNIWSFDLAEKCAERGFALDDNASYMIIFSADSDVWDTYEDYWYNHVESFSLIFGNDCFGDMAYLTGGTIENAVDSDRTSYIAEWVNADPAVYATPVTVTASGNVIGEVLPKGETFYATYCRFLDSNIDYASKLSGRTGKQTADDLAKTLGLTRKERDRAFKELGFKVKNGVLVRTAVP